MHSNNIIKYYNLFSFLLICISCAALLLGLEAEEDDEKISIRVTQHLSCPIKNKTNQWAIAFPSMQDAPVTRDTSLPGNCYRMTGPIKVNRAIKGKLYAYVEVKNGTSAPPSECRNVQPDGCKGIGSCVYCDLCGDFKKLSNNEVRVELKKGGQFNCAKGLERGTYEDTSFIFSVPPLKEFLKTLNIDRNTWNQFAAQGQAQTAFMTYYLFENDPINNLTRQELKKKIDKLDGVIGCHKLVMDVSSVKD